MEKNSDKAKFRMQIETPLDRFLHGRSWRKWWNFCEKHNINYYLFLSIAKFITKRQGFNFDEFEVYAIGQSHLDAAWLWTKISTVRRAIRTAEQAIQHFEIYPYFTFSQSTPQYYEWIKKLRPELFEKIKKFEKKGQWEIVGGMWVEPDLNIPNGESLVRQRLYGQLFFLDNFGKLATIESLEDSFGFNAQLPQILVKSGAEAFWTTKITWNDYTEFPFANFMWRGIDGSKIFTHMFLFIWGALFNLDKYKKLGRKIKEDRLIFDSSFTPERIEDFISDERVRTVGIFYGLGDGGMGPLQEEIDIMKSLARAGYLKFLNTGEYFEKLLEECGDHLPIWDDELYLELHRGVYTSQAETKRLNRLSEIKLRNAELLLSLMSLFFEKFEFPKNKMDKLWKDLLFNQFHDILPGSSIQDVYYEQEKELENVVEKTENYIQKVLKTLLFTFLTKKNLVKNYNDYIIIVNPLSWTRDCQINDTRDIKNPYSIPIHNLKPISFQILNLNEAYEKYQEIKEENHNPSEFKLLNSNYNISMENEKIYLNIDKYSGKITSLKFKRFNKELLNITDGIGFHVYEEKKNNWPAWEIYKGYTNHPVDIGIVKGIQIIEDTEIKKTVKIIFKFQKTTLIQHISLGKNSDKVDFNTEIDARDKNLLFKVRFPINLNTNICRAEIPYGYKERKMVPETDFEKGKWEFPALKYVDISEEELGVTLVNNSKYGFNANKKGLHLTLLHTPLRATDPFYSHLEVVPKELRTKHVDIGSHSIDYSLWLHEGDFFSSKAWRKGYEYNYPLMMATISEQDIDDLKKQAMKIKDKYKSLFKKELSIVRLSNPNIILHVIKKPETITLEKGGPNISKNTEKEYMLIIRLYETTGEPQNEVEIEFDDVFRIERAITTDLLERDLPIDPDKTIDIKDHRKLIVNFNKFEIKTIKIFISK